MSYGRAMLLASKSEEMRHDTWARSRVVKDPGSGQTWVQILSLLTKPCDLGEVTSPCRATIVLSLQEG